MSNNIAVSITADVADLVAKRAVLSAELKTATADLNAFAKTAATSGTTEALRTSMLAAADTVAKTRAQIKQLDTQLRGTAEVAVSTREAFEGLRIAQHLLTGDFVRAGEEVVKLSEKTAAHAGVAKLLEAALSPTGLAIAGVTAVTIAGIVAALQYEAAMERMETAVVGMGAASGQSRDRLESLAKEGNGLKLSIGEAEEAVTAFASAGVRDAQVIEQIKGAVADYAALTGQKATEATKQLADAMRDPVKGAEDLNEKLGFLDASQIEQIKTLVDLGDKTRAQAELSGLLKERTDEAAAASGHLQGGLTEVGNAAKDAWRELGGLTDQLAHYMAQAGAFGADAQNRAIQNTVAGARGHNAAAEAAAQRQAQLKTDSAGAAGLYADTPEAKAEQARNQRQGDVNKIQTGLAADIKLYGEHSAAVARDRQALSEYSRALATYKSDVDKKVESDKLDVQIATAKHSHNQALVADLSRQKSLISQAGVVESDADANALASGAGAVAGARGGGGAEKPKDDAVQVWREQLQTQLEDEKAYFADSSAEELKFWTARLAQTKQGSADERAVKTEIYNLDKQIAHQGYDEQIATLGDQLEAARDNWGQTQALWSTKLAFIGRTQGAQSAAYKNAQREWEAAEREHQAQLTEIARSGEEARLAELKSSADAARTIREADERTQESVINNKASGNPLAEIQAAQQIAAMRRTLSAQELADAQSIYMVEDNLRSQAVIDALAKYGTDSTQYKKALDDKQKADEDYFAHRAVLEDAALNRGIADAQTIRDKYVAAMQPIGTAFASTFQGMLGGQQSFQQGMIRGANEIASKEISTAAETLEHFLATQLTKKASVAAGAQAEVAIKASAAGQTTAISKATGMQELFANAKVAASGAYKAMAGIPLIGPELGAVAAAGTFAAVMALGSFDKGLDVVPSDMVAQIHAGERIIPASDNAAIISAMQSGGGRGGPGGRGGDGGSGGPITLNHNPTFNGVAGAEEAASMSHRELGKRLEKMRRRGQI